MTLRSQIAQQAVEIARLQAQLDARAAPAVGPWRRKEEWKRAGEQFIVTVEHFMADGPAIDHDDAGERWCVYAYIYPKHPRFKRFDGTGIYQDATSDLPLHSGCTYLRQHRDNDGSVTSFQVGADYNHLYDSRFTHEREFGGTVKADADRLFDFLTREQSPAIAMATIGTEPRDESGAEVAS